MPKALLDTVSLAPMFPAPKGPFRDKAQAQGHNNSPSKTACRQGAIMAVSSGTGTGRAIGGSALRLGAWQRLPAWAIRPGRIIRQQVPPVECGLVKRIEMLPPPSASRIFKLNPGAIMAFCRLSTESASMIARRPCGRPCDDMWNAPRHSMTNVACSGLGEDAVAFLSMMNCPSRSDMDGINSVSLTEAQKVEECSTAARLPSSPSRARGVFLDCCGPPRTG